MRSAFLNDKQFQESAKALCLALRGAGLSAQHLVTALNNVATKTSLSLVGTLKEIQKQKEQNAQHKPEELDQLGMTSIIGYRQTNSVVRF